ncbi:MAG: hypothetical protein A2451_14885 [Bdellovibrionales bacterium RIFOXYC2_FULL_39_8]|nr:MAG: hypothetical protein A2485_06225 [Bdellovibrionales bacterium RIFOXYC12_FULL_39_17]OFZ73739.1 MAG: hypothetical protein A2451_14885 [Bdellovibrionales bacterium RIFOXYC2_FULL_39_8]
MPLPTTGLVVSGVGVGVNVATGVDVGVATIESSGSSGVGALLTVETLDLVQPFISNKSNNKSNEILLPFHNIVSALVIKCSHTANASPLFGYELQVSYYIQILLSR